MPGANDCIFLDLLLACFLVPPHLALGAQLITKTDKAMKTANIFFIMFNY